MYYKGPDFSNFGVLAYQLMKFMLLLFKLSNFVAAVFFVLVLLSTTATFFFFKQCILFSFGMVPETPVKYVEN